jgi:two-component system osmolarity sensor histidine kinase EnvZ
MLKWNNLSGSLLARSVYLITIPIVLVQIIGIIIFFELHWDLVLKRSAQSISNEIKILELNKDSNSINEYANILEIIKTNNLDLSNTDEISNWIFKKRINQSLIQIPGKFIAIQNDKYFIIYNSIANDIFYLIPKKRVVTKTVGGFFSMDTGNQPYPIFNILLLH